MNLQYVAWQADDRKMCHPLPALQSTNHIRKGGGGGVAWGGDTRHIRAHTDKKRARCS